MFTHCLSCTAPIPEPGLPELRVRGERIAYDPARGRLWSICRTCRSWSLAPIEERWETVEELERITTRDAGSPGRARLLSRTDNIALFESGRLGIVRGGESNRLEEAWWRYGQQLHRRWHDERRVTVGGAALLGAAIVGGVLSTALPARYVFGGPMEVRRWLRFGDRAWTGHETCALCGHAFSELSFFDRKIVRLRPQEHEDAGPALVRRCPSCGDAHAGGLHLTGTAAEETLRRILAYQHIAGASEAGIRTAMDFIDREGSPSRLVGVLMRHTNQLGDLRPAFTIALEVAVNEERERRLLRLEIGALEKYWREAEALASIVDGELTHLSGVERLRLKSLGGA